MLDLLKDVRVVELTTIVLGPMAGQMLGDFGADVVKVEAPNGDLARYVDPRSQAGVSSMFANNNRNKKSIALDLKTAEGREILLKLIDGADVFLHNMRLQAVERLGLGPAELMARNPRLIYCSAIGFGSDGPYAARPAYDDVIQAASGIASLPTYTGNDPSYVPGVIADKIAALYAASAISAALVGRGRSGRGCEIEVPMFEVMTSFVMAEHMAAASFDKAAPAGYQRLLNRHRRPFPTSDGWIAVLPYTERHWRRTFEELGRGDVLAQPWFADATERSQHVGEMYEILGQEMPKRATEAWIATFERLDVPHSRVSGLDDLLGDPHLQAVGFFAPTDDLENRVRSVPQPVRFRAQPSVPDRRAPELGEDGPALLAELGFGPEAIRGLEARGVLGRMAGSDKEEA
ncbi:crotonobetainyl-CoA:carnitine CoA-transferase CaiB-like acyl-CoA transferase [Rhodovulum sulfidophilum]|uniref:CaiB/BaiF CoA transferase family protein n=1 Tax=Rhodovulum sulfidophilum TaxID=35806 RepID=UPI0005A6253A|nr:CoA transferase [Rhodovulum sulfidophilum]MCW2302653.1 crotonobetainyl-CoA:carnitine CoA-transferase CaiB-like acyl-CoA transferase [Rhodovulum sulfidophilum]